MLDSVQQIDDDVRLADGQCVEVLPHRQCLLLLRDPPFQFRSCHCRRVFSDTEAYSRGEDNRCDGVREGRGSREAIAVAVAV